MERDADPDDEQRCAQSGELIAQVGWIRALARQLVADAHRAEDLAQETCVIALEHEPRNAASIRAWLASVMLNLVRQSGRGEQRRRAREERVARAEALEATDGLVERVAMQRELVQAVLELDEPYRTTVLLRFFEELPPREIARRLAVPATTVQSRLTRGLRQLRERFDRTYGRPHGERRTWLALCVPLAAQHKTPFVLTIGGVIVNAKLTLAVLSVAVVATIVAVARLGDPHAPALAPSSEVAQAAAPAKSAEATLPDETETLGGAARRTEAAALVAAQPVNETPSAATPATRRVHGRAIDAAAAPVGGLALLFEGGAEKLETRTRAGGAFELETSASEGTLVSNDKSFATVRNGYYLKSSTFEPIVIVAPSIDLGGSVLDPQNAALAGARVSVTLPRGFETRFGQILEATHVLDWFAVSDEAGHFTLAHVPQIQGAMLRVLVDGYEQALAPEPEFSDPNLTFVLQRPKILATGALRGRVLDRDGQRVANARVAAGLTSTITDEKGEFTLDLSRAVTAAFVTAIKAGLRPASMQRPDEPEGDRTGWPDFIELRLGADALSISGHVLDPQGKPRAGVRVWVADPTPFGLIGRMPTQNENLMAGARVPEGALEPEPNPPREDGDSVITHRSAGGPANACWYWVQTDANGRFELAGLDDRKYSLRVLDPKTLQILNADPIQAGEHDAHIEMPAPAVFAKLGGRVTTLGDRPVAGVRISLRTIGFEVHTRYFGGKLNVAMLHPGDEATTDADGHFEFKDVPRAGVFFLLRSDRIVPTDWMLPADADPEHLAVHVDVRCQLEVRLKPPIDRGDEIALFDEKGQEIDLIRMNKDSVNMNSSVALIAGRSGVLSASSSSRILELRKNGVMVEKHAVNLLPDEINQLEF